MFEMKNESDRTATKNKNEDFLKELDKDRTEKGCEYAVLVSLLEPDSELYNTGIVDVFHRYPKMYVVRPQFFLPIITLLRNAAMNSLKYKTELALVKAQNIDITNFETELETFKTGVRARTTTSPPGASRRRSRRSTSRSTTSRRRRRRCSAPIDNLRLANDKAQDVTIKKLTGATRRWRPSSRSRSRTFRSATTSPTQLITVRPNSTAARASRASNVASGAPTRRAVLSTQQSGKRKPVLTRSSARMSGSLGSGSASEKSRGGELGRELECRARFARHRRALRRE